MTQRNNSFGVVQHRRLAPPFSAPAASQRRAGKPARSSVGVVLIGLALLVCGCAKVHVTPLGSLSDGRRQFEITCNKHATDDGTCNQTAVAQCEGSYETQSVRKTRAWGSSNGGISTAPAERSLLIACHH